MRVTKRHKKVDLRSDGSISDDAVAEVIQIVSIFSCCGPSNGRLMRQCDGDDSRLTSPFIDDREIVATYWSFRDSSACVDLNTGSFGTRDASKIQSMISAYIGYEGDAADNPLEKQMSGLKLVWQLSRNPTAICVMRISDELVCIAQNAFEPHVFNVG